MEQLVVTFKLETHKKNLCFVTFELEKIVSKPVLNLYLTVWGKREEVRLL